MSQTFFFTDLDGTLEDSRADMTAAARRVRARFGLPAWPNERLTPFVNKGMRELYLSCFADMIEAALAEGEDRDAVIERIRVSYEADYIANVANETRLYEGMKSTLEALAARGKVVVITNKPEAISRRLLDALGVGALITDVMGGDSCPETKPSPTPLRIAAERHGYVAGRDAAFMMGDTLADVRCGKAFGAKTIWCTYGYLDALPESDVPDFVARAPEEIPAIVEGA